MLYNLFLGSRMQQNVFVNRILNMKKIKYIGLDMDHTLIRYKTINFESLVYDLVIDDLIKHKHYPAAIKDFVFKFQDAIRGLVVDSKNGNILKLSRYAAIRQSFHGTKMIGYAEQKHFYRSIYVDLNDPNYMSIDTSFSIAFCVLYGQLIDLKDKMPIDMPSYSEIALDVLSSVDKVHADGSLKKTIAENLDNFVIKDPLVVEGLKRLLQYKKKIFILTNSDFAYTNLLLNYAIQPFLEKGQHWQDIFEYTITLANKPRFFYDNLKFLKINPDNGCMTNSFGKITPGIYQGGHAKKFTDDLALRGDEILYIGDHIYGDILRLKKACNWRTALVVEELGDEISAQTKALAIDKDIQIAMNKKIVLEQEAIDIHTQQIEKGSKNGDERLATLHQLIQDIDNSLSVLIKKQQAFYNSKWDRVFRAGSEESYFAYQVDRFACIYMEKLSDLLGHSPLTYFRANKRLLAHDYHLES
jgi:HAD superfamily 5'-nucleotidase-like hydrolase